MKLKTLTILSLVLILTLSCVEKSTDKGVKFINKEAEKTVDVMINGKLFTSYYWADNVMKPILFPILTNSGNIITRGYPLVTRPGETIDHPHHTGSWLNYGNVNGFDFWGNKGPDPADTTATAMARRNKYGSIKHLNFEKISDGGDEGILIANASWVIDTSKKELLKEITEYHFIDEGEVRIIDRITTLTANEDSVIMNDTKEGMFGIRVARELELPSKNEVPLTDSTVITPTGNYRSSEGVTGGAVWSTRARWMDLYGNLGDEKVSVVICDHPKNQSYPTYWHARGYGLFCLNPFGARDFTKGQEVLNYTILPGESITLRYRTIISSGAHLTDEEINSLADDFAKKY